MSDLMRRNRLTKTDSDSPVSSFAPHTHPCIKTLYSRWHWSFLIRQGSSQLVVRVTIITSAGTFSGDVPRLTCLPEATNITRCGWQQAISSCVHISLLCSSNALILTFPLLSSSYWLSTLSYCRPSFRLFPCHSNSSSRASLHPYPLRSPDFRHLIGVFLFTVFQIVVH